MKFRNLEECIECCERYEYSKSYNITQKTKLSKQEKDILRQAERRGYIKDKNPFYRRCIYQVTLEGGRHSIFMQTLRTMEESILERVRLYKENH